MGSNLSDDHPVLSQRGGVYESSDPMDLNGKLSPHKDMIIILISICYFENKVRPMTSFCVHINKAKCLENGSDTRNVNGNIFGTA